MKIEDAIINQNEVVRLLKNSIEKNILSHAYIFDGDEGSGKYEIAIYISMLLLCESNNKPCFKCHNCIRIQNNNHMNVTVIEPTNDMIKKEQIDGFIHELMMTSIERGPQIGIIKDADKMNPSATNALLKMLEEPAPNHYIFLLTNNANKLLDTIISRSQVIRFKPLSRKFIIKELNDIGVDSDLSYVLSYVTNDLEDAKHLIEEGKITNIISLAKDIMITIAKKKDPLVTYFNNADIIKKEDNKNYHRIFLDVLVLINKEILNKINNIQSNNFNDVTNLYDNQTIDAQSIIKHIDVLENYQMRLNYYVNLNLFYTSLMIEMSK